MEMICSDEAEFNWWGLKVAGGVSMKLSFEENHSVDLCTNAFSNYILHFKKLSNGWLYIAKLAIFENNRLTIGNYTALFLIYMHGNCRLVNIILWPKLGENKCT